MNKNKSNTKNKRWFCKQLSKNGIIDFTAFLEHWKNKQ